MKKKKSAHMDKASVRKVKELPTKEVQGLPESFTETAGESAKQDISQKMAAALQGLKALEDAQTIGREKERPLLTIGMIVKNEGKVLERCLRSLIPLQKALKCEIIIADTGSTDDTKEVALRYADEVFDFTWINDFAAARNAVLKRAHGVWYVSIDADEYLDEDISPLLEFFNSPTIHQYDAAEWRIRSYSSQEMTNFTEMLLPRIYRITENTKYKSPIHEYISLPADLKRVASIKMLVHHTGYSFESLEMQLKKAERNLQLMRIEYEKHPNDLSAICQLLDSLFMAERNEEADVVSHKALQLAYDTWPSNYSQALMARAIRCDNIFDRPEKVAEIVDQYDTYAVIDDSNIDFYFEGLNAYSTLENWDKIAYYGKKYLDSASSYQKNGSQNNPLVQWEIRCITKEHLCKAHFLWIASLEHLGEYKELLSAIKQVDFLEMTSDQFAYTMQAFIHALSKESAPEAANTVLAEMEELRASDEKQRQDRANQFERILLSFYDAFEDNKPAIAQLTASDYENHAIAFLRFAMLPKVEKQQFIDTYQDWASLKYISAYYYCIITEKLHFSERTVSFSFQQLQQIAQNMKAFFSSSARRVQEYVMALPVEQQPFLLSALRSSYLQELVLQGTREQGIELLSDFCARMELCLKQLYQPAVLTEAYCWRMQAYHRFAFWLIQAMKTEDNKRVYFAKAQEARPDQKDILDFLQEEQKYPAEVQALFLAIKHAAYTMAEQGQLNLLKPVLLQLQHLCPEDIELQELVHKFDDSTEDTIPEE